jgi:hypothetical protein
MLQRSQDNLYSYTEHCELTNNLDIILSTNVVKLTVKNPRNHHH